MLKKHLAVILLFSFSPIALGVSLHKCKHGEFNLNISTNKAEPITMTLLKKESKISTCTFEVVSYDDGKTGASTSELIRFSTKNCSIIFDKIAAKIDIIDDGFVKIDSGAKNSYVNIVKNQHPLVCSYSKQR